MALLRVLSSIGRRLCLRGSSVYLVNTAPRHGSFTRTYTTDEAGRREIMKKLAACPGGSVDLTKSDDTGIAVMSFNNPKARNAFSGQMVIDLDKAVTELESWRGGKALVVHGIGGYFSSGGDLKTVWEIADPVSGLQFCSLMQDILQRFLRLPLISVAMIQGKALGGGAELAMATDFRIMTQKAGLGFIQAHMNITTGYGGGTLLTRLVGRTRALDLLASGRQVGPEEALQMGLVDKVVPETDDTVDLGKAWLSPFTKVSPQAIAGAKANVTAATELSVRDSLEHERQVFGSLWGSEEHRRILKKVMEKK